MGNSELFSGDQGARGGGRTSRAPIRAGNWRAYDSALHPPALYLASLHDTGYDSAAVYPPALYPASVHRAAHHATPLSIPGTQTILT